MRRCLSLRAAQQLWHCQWQVQADITRQQQALSEARPSGLREELSALKEEAWRLDLFAQLERMKDDILRGGDTQSETPCAASTSAKSLEQAVANGTEPSQSQTECGGQSALHAATALQAERSESTTVERVSARCAPDCEVAPAEHAGCASGAADEAVAGRLVDMLRTEQEDAASMLADLMLEVEVRPSLTSALMMVCHLCTNDFGAVPFRCQRRMLHEAQNVIALCQATFDLPCCNVVRMPT